MRPRAPLFRTDEQRQAELDFAVAHTCFVCHGPADPRMLGGLALAFIRGDADATAKLLELVAIERIGTCIVSPSYVTVCVRTNRVQWGGGR